MRNSIPFGYGSARTLCQETVNEVDNPLWFGQSRWFRSALELLFNDVSLKEKSYDDT